MLRVSTWNIAAINNNPFEYWVTYHDSDYNEFMRGVESLLGQDDGTLVQEVFTTEMYNELADELHRLGFPDMEEIGRLWSEDISQRRVIQGFLKDKSIGDKRLASMPDRITNTIHLVDGSTLRRPTVINAFGGSPLSSMGSWWASWKKFMFHTEVEVFSGKKVTSQRQMVWSLISPILRAKYPAVTPEEQAISVQLQILYLAVLDAVFIFIANRVAPERWEKIRQNLCDALIYNKDSRVCDILATSYRDERVVFLQEASAAFVHKAQNHRMLSEVFKILIPLNFNGKRDQNSIILVSRAAFDASTVADVTDTVLGHIDGNFLEAGDLFALRIDDVGGQGYLLVSFHGDSNGLSTRPVLVGLHEAFRQCFNGLIFVGGIDSNTSSQASDKFHHGVRDFRALLEKQGMVSVWDKADDRMITTTCSARTSLQMQLNKAVSFKNRFSKANMSLKDWILAYGAQVEEITDADRDNTGERKYVGETMLPTTSFPSDHAIVSCRIKLFLVQTSWADGGDVSSALLSHSERPRGSDRTLYDYWGLADDRRIRSIVGSEFDMPRPSSWSLQGLSIPVVPDREAPNGEACSTRLRRFSQGDLRQCVDAMSQESSTWILFSARPNSVALTKGWYQLLFLVMCAPGLFDAWHNSSRAAAYVGVRGHQFRLTIGHRDQSSGARRCPAGVGHDAEQGLDDVGNEGSDAVCDRTRIAELRLNSPRPLVAFSAKESFGLNYTESVGIGQAQVVFTFQEGGEWLQGFIFTAYGLESVESLLVRAELSPDGVLWSELPLPLWTHMRHTKSTVPTFWTTNAPSGGPLTIEWSLLPCWQWTLELCFCQGKTWGAFLCSAGLGRLGYGRLGTLLLALSFFLNSVAFSAIILSYNIGPKFSTPYAGQSLSLLKTRVVINLLLSIMIAYEGNYLVDIGLFTGGLLSSMVAYARILALQASPDKQHYPFLTIALNGASAMFTFGPFIAVQVARRRVRNWISNELIKEDREEYDAMWASIISKDSEVSALNRLRLLTRPLSFAWSKGGPRQVSASSPKGIFMGAWEGDEPGGSPVTSLDDLYSVALTVDPLLQVEAEALAREAGGQVVAQSSEALSFGQGPVGSLLKPWVRSVEKVVRSYGGDPSRVLDCSRRSLAFMRVADVLKCMESLTSTEHIEVVRVSNLVVNLLIKSPKARELGVDHHICELQLTLRSFSDALNPESHRRYQILRNCRQDLSDSSLVLPWSVWMRRARALLSALVDSAHFWSTPRRAARL